MMNYIHKSRVSVRLIAAIGFAFFSLINTLSAQNDWQEIGEIEGLVPSALLGGNIDISGDGSRIVVSGNYRTNSSERSPFVSVYEHNGTSWSVVNSVIPFSEIIRDVKISKDGDRIALSVSLAVSGQTNHVVIYEDNGSSWIQLGNLILSDQRGTLFGESISISSDCSRVAIGDSNDETNGSNSGKVVVYSFEGSEWTQTGQTLFGSGEDSRIGGAVALSGDGNSLLVSDMLENAQGQLIAYNLVNNQWVQKGNLITGTVNNARFGTTLSINDDGSVIAAASDISTGGSRDAQFARIYQLTGSFWDQLGDDLKSNIPEDQYGTGLALSSTGNRLAISAPYSKENDSEDDRGIIYVYELKNGHWVDLGNRIQKPDFSRLGVAVALSADGLNIVSGDHVGVSFAGVVNVYEFQNDYLAEYSFNSGFIDNSINGNDATNSGAVLVEDRFGRAESAVSFSGGSQITTPIVSQPKAISLWYKENAPDGTIFTWGQEGGANYYYGYELVSISNGLQFYFSLADGSNSPITNSVTLVTTKDDSWHQFVVTEEVSGQLSFYIDNVLVETFTASSSNPIYWEGGNGLLTIGENFQGALDDIIFYNDALNESEINESFVAEGDAAILGDYSFTSNLNDDSGLGNNAINNGATFATDRFGFASSALSFNGNSSVRIDNTPSISDLSGSYSASMWINSQSASPSNPMTILSKGLNPDDNTNTSLSVYLNTDLTLSFFWEDQFDQDNVVTTTQSLTPSRYYLITVTVNTDNNTSSVYIDEELVASESFISPPSSNVDPLYIGAELTGVNTQSNYFFGDIDDIKIYNNKALTLDDIAEIYGENDWNPDLLGDFTFNGGPGDESNNANIGAIRGAGVSLTENRFGAPNSSFTLGGSGYLAYSHIDSYDLGQTRDFSISGWFNSTSTSTGTIFDKSNGEVGYQVLLSVDGSVTFSINNTTESFSLSTDAGYDDGNWHYFVVQVDRDAGISLIMDGSTNFSNSSITENLSFDTSEDLLIGITAGAGNIGPNTSFRGSLDDIQFFSKTLTVREILNTFNNGVESVSIAGSVLTSNKVLNLQGGLGNFNSTWSTVINAIAPGNLSFYYNGAASSVYGDTDLDGFLELEGNPISIPAAGQYYVQAYPAVNEYIITQINSVGILGDALDGFNAEDVDLASLGSGVYYMEDIMFSNGEIKFRANNTWDINWGDDDLNGIFNSRLFETLEEDSPVLEFFEGLNASIVTNPDISGINTSNKVIQAIKGSQPVGGLYFDIEEKLNVINESIISVKVWAPGTGYNFRLKLENSSDNSDFQEFDLTIPVAQEWIELTFDLSRDIAGNPAKTGLYDRIVLFPGWDVANISGSFYIDDIFLGYEALNISGSNIPVNAGTYNVLIDVANNVYSISTVPFNGSDIRNIELITSSGLYTDSGGTENGYSADEDFTSTIRPEVPGEAINLEFIEFSVEADYDYLYIYDGLTVNDPLIGVFTGNNGPQSVVAANLNGALTLRFVSDGFVQESGWQANISTSLLAAPELVGEYFFNDNVDDNSLAGNNGLNFNATYVGGRLPIETFGGAYSFDGSTSYLSIPDSWTLSRATSQDFSVSGWFRSTENGVFFDKSDGLIGYQGLIQANGTLLFLLTESSIGNVSIQTSSTWNDGQWHFFSMEADRDTGLSIYVDNDLKASNLLTSNTISVTTAEDFLIGVAGEAGNTNLNNYFNGELDDVRIHSKVLSEQERFDIFNVGEWFDSINLLSYLQYSGNDIDEQNAGVTSTSFSGSFQVDRFGNEQSALLLDGISQFNTHSGQVFVNASSSSLDQAGSVSIWINPTNNPSGNATLYQFINPSTSEKYLTDLVLESDGSLSLTMNGLSSNENIILASNSLVELQRWTHVVVVWDVTQDIFELYIDGSLDNSISVGTITPKPLVAGVTYVKGYDANTSSSFYLGGIDDISVYKDNLNEQQIGNLYNEDGWPSQLVSEVSLTISGDGVESEFSLRQEIETSSVNWSGSLYLNEGENVLFGVVNNGSTINYGDFDGEDNIADKDASAIIINQSGDYYIRFNASSNEYLVYAINSIGFLGSARTGDDTGWLGDDDNFNNEGNGNYVIRNIALFEGLFKFRANDDWSILNWGDTDVDGIMEITGADTEITQGSYDIIFNVYDRSYSVTPALGDPIVLSASPTSSSEIKLRWQNIGNETGYRIFRADDPINTSYDFVTEVGSDVAEFTDSGLTPNKGYVYILQTINDQLVNSGTPVITSTFSNNLDTKNENLALIGGGGNDYGRDITFDDEGNYYVLGTFNQSIEIAGTTISALNDGLFVAKYNSAHVAQWIVDVDPAAGSIEGTDIVANAIKISPSGLVYITGFYSGIVNSVATHQDASNEFENNLFVISLSQEGVIFDTRILSSTGFSAGDKIDFDNESNLYVSGGYSGDASFAGTSLSGGGPVILKWLASGEESWAVSPTQSSYLGIGRAYGLALDRTNNVIYTTGISYGTTDFSNNGTGVYVGSELNFDIFLASYNEDGSFNWVSGIDSDRTDVSYDVVLDPSNNPVIAGYFNGPSLAIGSKSYNNEEQFNEILLVKYDQSGNALNSSVATSDLGEYSLGMASNSQDIFLTGYKDPVLADFGGLSVENGKGFLASFDGAELTTNWVEVIEGNALGVSLAASDDYVYLAGRATNAVNLAGNVLSSDNESDDAMFGVFRTSVVSSQGLVGYYTFTDGSTEDFSGSGNDGVQVNTPLFSKDRYGNPSSSFEPRDDQSYVEISHNGSFDFTGAFTLAMWVRLNDYSDEERDILFKDDGFGILSIDNQGRVAYDWRDASNTNVGLVANSVDFAIERNQWTYIALSVDENADARILINGQLQINNFVQNGNIIGSPAEVFNISQTVNVGNIAYISSNVFSDTFLSDANGDIDDVRIYSGVSLSQSEIQGVYNVEISGGEDRLVAQYEFTSGELADISGNSFDGEFYNENNQTIGVQLTTGLDGDTDGALDFDDNGDHMNVFHQKSINLRRDFTVNLWVKPENASNGSFGDVVFADGAAARLMYGPSNEIFYHYPDIDGGFPSLVESGNSMEIGSWQMLTYSIDADDNLKVYKNGQIIISGLVDNQQFSLPENFKIAQNDLASPTDIRYMDGAIDKVSIYQRVLSDVEIAEMFNEDDNRLIAYYPFNGNANDLSGNGFNASVNNASLSEDRNNQSNLAYSFDGISSSIESSLSTHPSGEVSVTYMAWVFPNGDNVTGGIINVGESVANGRSAMLIGNNTIEYVGENNDVSSGVQVPGNQWSHIVLTKSGTNIDFYLNGQLVSSGSTNTGQNVQSGITTIGSSFGTREYFDGKIDEVRIYNQPISATQINNIFIEEAPDLIGYYTFDEGSAIDYSVYGRNLTPNNVFLATDRYGTANRAADFNGTDGYLQGPIMDQLFTGGPFSISAWVNWRNGTGQYETIVSWYSEQNGIGTFLGADNTTVRFGDANLNTGVSLPSNEWAHIVATFDGNTGEIYLNNSLLASNLNGPFSFGEFVIGRQGVSDGEYFNGVIDDIRIYKSHLSDIDVENIFISESVSTEPPVAASNVGTQVIAPGTVRVEWSDNSDNEIGFYVNYSVGSNTFSTENTGSNITSLIIENLTNDVAYTFEVVAFNSNGDTPAENTTSATPVLLEDPVSINPSFASLDDEITITLTVANLYPVDELRSTADKIYLHSGLVVPGNENRGGWEANAEWGVDHGIGLMTDNADGTWSITISDPRNYYQVADDYVASQIALIFRNANGTVTGAGAYNQNTETGDIFIDLYDSALYPKEASSVATLDGTNNLFINAPYPNEAALIGNSQLTLEAWVNITDLPAVGSYYGVYTRETSNGLPTDLYIVNQNGSSFVVFSIENQDRSLNPNVNIPISSDFVGQWHHLAATYDGTEMKLFVDGYLVGQTTTSVVLFTTSDSTADKVTVGELMNGKVDDVRLWSFAKSQDQIRREISFELGGSETNLAANWNFNTTIGSGPFFTPDITGNGNDLELSTDAIIGEPDLAVSISSSPSDVVVGFTGYSVSGTIINTSQSELPVNQQVNLALYLSDDANFDSGDLVLATNTESVNLAINSAQAYSMTFDMPSTVVANNYNLIVRIDDSELLSESDENNNISITPIEVFDVLSQPTSLVLSNATNTSFEYSWNALDANTWEYDVSFNSGFTSIVNGLSGERTTQNSGVVSGLNPETTYFFRVRAVDPNIEQRTSNYSQTRQISTNNTVDSTSPTVSITGALPSSEQAAQNITVSFNDDIGVSLVEVYTRGGAEDIGTEVIILTESNPTTLSLNVTIPSSAWDQYGVTFYARVSDLAGNEAFSNVYTTVLDIPATASQTIPVNAVGVSQSNYRMFAFPYLQKSTSQVIQGAESSIDWKLQRYSASNGRNSNVSTLRPSEGYWFLKRNTNISITFDNASPVVLNGESFTMRLDNGWTQIGNPYLGTINWEAVLDYNNIPLDDEISILQSYIGGGYSIVSNLQRYQGVFVFSSTARNIEVPLSAVNRTGGSRAWVKENGGWETVIKLFAEDGLRSFASGFGQIANAQIGHDRFDIKTAPLFSEYVRAEFVEDESLLDKQLARSYHSIETNDSWTMKVYSHFGQGSPMTMQLEKLPSLENNEIMAMLDMETGYSALLSDDIDYTFNYTNGYEIKFIKGTREFVNQSMVLNQLMFSDLYPNPSNGVINLSINSPEFESSQNLHFSVYDLSGHVVFSHHANVSGGYQQFLLDLRNKFLTNGLYMLEIEFSDKSSNWFEKITKKVYLKGVD